MALPDLDSSVGHSFGLEVDGITIKSITEVSGLKMEQDVIELKQNGPDGKYMIKKLPGRWKSGEVTLTRPLTADQSFEKWVQDSQFGKMSAVRRCGVAVPPSRPSRLSTTVPIPRWSVARRNRVCGPSSASSCRAVTSTAPA